MYVSNDYGYKATQKQKHRISKHNDLEYPCDDCNYCSTAYDSIDAIDLKNLTLIC